MMTLDVAPETWDNMIFAARKELYNLDRREPDRTIAAAIRAALLVMMIQINPKGE